MLSGNGPRTRRCKATGIGKEEGEEEVSHSIYCCQTNTEEATSKEQSPSWKANSSSTTIQLPSILYRQVHNRVHNIWPFVPIPSEVNSIHALPFYIITVNFNIILPFTSRSSKWSLSLSFPHQSPVCNSPPPSTRHTPHTSHLKKEQSIHKIILPRVSNEKQQIAKFASKMIYNFS